MARFLHPDIRMQTFLNDLPISPQVIASVSTSAGTTSEAGSIHSPLGATSVDHSIITFCVRCKAVKCSGYEGYFPLHIGARKWLDSKFYQWDTHHHSCWFKIDGCWLNFTCFGSFTCDFLMKYPSHHWDLLVAWDGRCHPGGHTLAQAKRPGWSGWDTQRIFFGNPLGFHWGFPWGVPWGVPKRGICLSWTIPH